MPGLRNIFACLVHERPECVVDLVRNLHALDPESLILLYNGGASPDLFSSHFSFAQHNAVFFPTPHPARWGHLHHFALECMEWALEHHPFDTFTIVDSDQLATRPGYSHALARYLENAPAKLGILGNSPAIQPGHTTVGPARCAHAEFDLWRPFLREFPEGESKWVHWFFWPSTVFLADAARDLVHLWSTSQTLRDTMARSAIWATEEVLLPTLVSLLGYEVAANPFSYDFVQYKTHYTPSQVQSALDREEVFWIHPVLRSYEDPIRTAIRQHFQHYALPHSPPEPAMSESPTTRLMLTLPLLQRMRSIEGWLDDAEADLLIAAVTHAVRRLPDAPAPVPAIVEVGSFCGKATVVLAGTLAGLSRTEDMPAPKLHAIDPHDGIVGASGQNLLRVAPTLDKLKLNLAQAGLTDYVNILPTSTRNVSWDQPIAFLLIDGLHDYASVSQDFHRFESFLVPGSLVAFHDYANYFPGVKTFVDDLLRTTSYQRIHHAGTMLVVEKRGVLAVAEVAEKPVKSAAIHTRPPLVSCLMPTADRRHLVPRAMEYFLRQDHPNRELIVIDDGIDSISDLIPNDSSIRYLRLDQRQTIGFKHNLACSMAKGEFVVHWDDDDWMANWRLSYQIRCIAPEPVDTLSGTARLLFWDPRTCGSWEYIYPESQRPWVAGGTFCYRRRFWENHPFPEMNEGGDTVFVWGLRDSRIQVIPNANFYVALIHAQNTSRKRTQTPGWQPVPLHRINTLLGNDLAFYESWASSPWIGDTIPPPPKPPASTLSLG